VKEVIAVTPALQAYATRDAGFQQFSDRHATVSADPQTRRDYVSWFSDMLREEGRIDAVRQEYEPLLAESEEKLAKSEEKLAKSEEKLAESKQKLEESKQKLEKSEEKLLTSARNMKKEGIPIEVIAKAFSLTDEQIADI
jgi:septal ring factor EnvC (AmiA/AmiB activator)